MRRNGPQKGFAWPKQVPAYHATTALDAVLREGLKSRAELTGELKHAAGGGPEESVSFTLDIRVARAICAGLRTLVLCAKREMSTAELFVAMDAISPKLTLETRKEEKLDNDTVLRLDEGLYGVKAGMGWGPRYSVEMKGKNDIERFEEMERKGLIVDAEYQHAGTSPRPYAAHGWAQLDVVSQLTDYYTLPELESQPWCYDAYKRFLFFGDVAKKVYDPLFFMTRMQTLRNLDIEQIGIVEARIDADWICGDMSYMRQLGYDMEGLFPSAPDWPYACENRLRDQASGKSDLRDISYTGPSREWEPPDAWDTVYYTAAMAEVRVYDRALVTDLQEREDIHDVMAELEVDWFNQGVQDIEDPIAAPFFRSQDYSLRQRGYLR